MAFSEAKIKRNKVKKWVHNQKSVFVEASSLQAEDQWKHLAYHQYTVGEACRLDDMGTSVQLAWLFSERVSLMLKMFAEDAFKAPS